MVKLFRSLHHEGSHFGSSLDILLLIKLGSAPSSAMGPTLPIAVRQDDRVHRQQRTWPQAAVCMRA